MHGVRVRRAVVPVEHRVHPAHQRPRRRRRGARHRVRRAVPGARARRRVPRRAGGHSAGSAAPAGDHEVQPGPDLDTGERRRHRRGVPVHLRHGGPRRLPVRRPHHAGVEPLPPARRAVFEPGTPWLLRYFDRISFYPVSAEELLDLRADMAAGRGDGRHHRRRVLAARATRFLAEHAESIAAFRQQQSVRVRGRTGRRGTAPVSSPDRSRARRRCTADCSPGCGTLFTNWTADASTPKAKMAAENESAQRGRAQVRRRRSNRVPLVRRAVRRRARRAATHPDARRRVLRHPRPRPGRATASPCGGAPADPTRAGT